MRAGDPSPERTTRKDTAGAHRLPRRPTPPHRRGRRRRRRARAVHRDARLGRHGYADRDPRTTYTVAVSPDGATIVAGSGVGSEAMVVDAATGTATGIPLTGDVGQPIVDGTGTTAYAGSMGGFVNVIDVATSTLTRSIPVPNGPSGVALSPDGTTLYVAQVLTPAGSPGVAVVDVASGTVVRQLPSQNGPSTVLLSRDGATLFVANTASGTVSFVDVASGTARAVAVGAAPLALALSPDGTRLSVANSQGQDVSLVDTATGTVVANVALPGGAPEGLALSADGAVLYASDGVNDTIDVIDTVAGVVIDTFRAAVGHTARGPRPEPRRIASVRDEHGREAAARAGCPPRPAITTTSLPAGTVGTPYSATIAATPTSDVRFSITDGTLPRGLALDPQTGTVSEPRPTAGSGHSR